MNSKYFEPWPQGLSEAQAAARLKRQRCAEWGVAVASLSGNRPDESVLAELQRYIDGVLPIEEFAQVKRTPAYQAILTRERLLD